jgi:hypothetical protein
MMQIQGQQRQQQQKVYLDFSKTDQLSKDKTVEK